MNKFISALVVYRWRFALAALAIFSISCFGLKSFNFDASPHVFFEKGFKPFERLETMEAEYGEDFKIFFMVSAKQGRIFESKNLKAIQAVTEEAWTLPFVRRVDSVTNFQYTHSHDDELFVEGLVDDEVLSDPQLLKQREHIALSNADVANRLISTDGQHAAVLFSLSMTGEQSQSEEGKHLVELVYELEERVKQEFPSVDVAITGSVISTYHSMEVVAHDIVVMMPIMFLLMFVLLGLFLRSISAIVVTLVVAVFSTVGAFGFASWFGITFSMLAMNTLIICLTVSVAHCIHIFLQFSKELQTKPKAEALSASLNINFFAVTVTSAMTMIGFLSLNFNELPPAVALGNASAIGAVLAWLYSLLLLPALVMLLPFNPHQSQGSAIERTMLLLADWLIRNRYRALFGTGIVSIVMIVLSFSNQLNDRLVETLHEPHIFRSDARLVDEHFGGLYMNNYDFDSGEEYGITDPAYLKNLEKFVDFLRADPDITSVVAFSDTIKRLNQSFHNDDPEYYRIPDDKELISQYLLMYEMSLPLGLDLTERISMDKRKSLVTATLPAQDSLTNMALDQRIWQWQQQNLPQQLQTETASLTTIWSYLVVTSLGSSIEGSAIALTLISFLLLFMLRSIKLGIISLVPNILPAVFGFGFWYLYSGNIGVGLMCVSIITIGIVVDDTVHFLAKYQKALKETENVEAAIRATFKQVGPALFVTTVVLASGFSVMAFSGISLNSGMGLTTSIILVAAFLLDVILLPALLLVFDDKARRKIDSA